MNKREWENIAYAIVPFFSSFLFNRNIEKPEHEYVGTHRFSSRLICAISKRSLKYCECCTWDCDCISNSIM